MAASDARCGRTTAEPTDRRRRPDDRMRPLRRVGGVTASQDYRRQGYRLRRAWLLGPDVAQAGGIADLFERRIERADLGANAPDRGPHVDAIAVIAVTGDKTAIVHTVIDLAVGDGPATALDEKVHNLELTYRQADILAFP